MFNQITSNIYLGQAIECEDVPILKELGIKAVLAFDFIDPGVWKCLLRNRMIYKFIPVKDFDLPTHTDIKKAFDFLDTVLNKGMKVYVHCIGGKGRSNLMLMLYFVSKGMEPKVVESKIAAEREVVGFTDIQRIYFDILQQWHIMGRRGSMPTPDDAKNLYENSRDDMEGLDEYDFVETPYRQINPSYEDDANQFKFD